MAFHPSIDVRSAGKQAAKKTVKKAAKKKSETASPSTTAENPLAELLKAIESGLLGPIMTVQRVPKASLNDDVFAQSFGRIAEKLVRTDERIDALTRNVEALLYRSGIVSVDVPVVRNENCFAQPPADRDRLGAAIAVPMEPKSISIDESMKMLQQVASYISDYVEFHRARYAAVTNQATKADLHIDQIPPATCELQSMIHGIVHALMISHAELREMASRSLV